MEFYIVDAITMPLDFNTFLDFETRIKGRYKYFPNISPRNNIRRKRRYPTQPRMHIHITQLITPPKLSNQPPKPLPPLVAQPPDPALATSPHIDQIPAPRGKLAAGDRTGIPVLGADALVLACSPYPLVELLVELDLVVGLELLVLGADAGV